MPLRNLFISKQLLTKNSPHLLFLVDFSHPYNNSKNTTIFAVKDLEPLSQTHEISLFKSSWSKSSRNKNRETHLLYQNNKIFLTTSLIVNSIKTSIKEYFNQSDFLLKNLHHFQTKNTIKAFFSLLQNQITLFNHSLTSSKTKVPYYKKRVKNRNSASDLQALIINLIPVVS